MKRKATSDPVFAAEMEALAETHRSVAPLTDEERAKLAEPVIRDWTPLHVHKDACWGRPYETTVRDANGTHRLMVQQCRYSGTKREVPQ